VGKLQLWPTFPGKRLIKTYATLWKSCRSIAPLQLSYLEIFNLVGTFWSYAISKQAKWNENGRSADVAALRRARVSPCATRPPHLSPAYGLRCLHCGPPYPVGPSVTLTPAYAAPRQRVAPGEASTREPAARPTPACRASCQAPQVFYAKP
jgi:hypothetical protein